MPEVIPAVVGMAFVGVLLLVLWSIVRFSIISPLRTRGAAERLRHPDVPGVERVCGFRLPRELGDFYAHSPLVDMTEFYLVDGRAAKPRT